MSKRKLDELIYKYKNGDKECFDEIYYLTYNAVYLSIRIIIKDRQIIEDLIQETYMKAIDNLEKYHMGTNFSAWISSIARNISINYYNREKKVELKEDNNPVFLIENKDSKLEYYLSFLKDEERSVVIYHLVLNFKFKEIANMLNMPLSTVFAIYKKAVERIKKTL